MFNFLGGLINFILLLVFVAFFVLLERNILGLIQQRKGPNKVGIFGLLQSFTDLIKLIIKVNKNTFYNYRSIIGFIGVNILLVGTIFFCYLHYLFFSGSEVIFFFLFILLIGSLTSYSILFVGLGSLNKFSYLGSIRSSFTALCYEGALMCFILFLAYCNNTYSGFLFYLNETNFNSFYLIWPFYLTGLILLFCETNRTPFDYSESESDLVSGFNIEFGSVYFTCLFACEYLLCYIVCWIFSICFFSSPLFICLSASLGCFILIVVRAILPRFNYYSFVKLFWHHLIIYMSFYLLILL
uniref:NADH-ubiquinone oxidoreductase chain 1 n=1 Tax=Aglaiogyrodactylus forficulatus TaxID=1853073 RepID=A0A173G4T4_9PLAT|nr:NADH dehydrogenase subunit 1 [Aglaiogyrodactylus forficulatus]ANH20410.1 NADH dehydrogenase subunit 1 [Aglaiogyrodactylus forficulatus]